MYRGEILSGGDFVQGGFCPGLVDSSSRYFKYLGCNYKYLGLKHEYKYFSLVCKTASRNRKILNTVNELY